MGARFSLNIKFCYRNNWCCVCVGRREEVWWPNKLGKMTNGNACCLNACVFTQVNKIAATTGWWNCDVCSPFSWIFCIWNIVLFSVSSFLWQSIKLMNYKEYIKLSDMATNSMAPIPSVCECARARVCLYVVCIYVCLRPTPFVYLFIQICLC